ncbi:MAG: GIY-YIG nuclease family protein [Negativicutes bacterium]|nr:GIY-YIG nuclease family protein [Negativicutes bacterium]
MDKRKELKLAYKMNPRPMGVYRLKNSGSNKSLVGSSMNLPGKKNSIFFQLELGSFPNKAVQADWNAHGPDTFTFEILETIKPAEIPETDWREAVTALEEKWLDKLQPYGDNGYNIRKIEQS